MVSGGCAITALAHAATPGIKPHRSINLKMVRPRHWACEDDGVNNRLDKSIIVRESIKERFILGDIGTRTRVREQFRDFIVP